MFGIYNSVDDVRMNFERRQQIPNVVVAVVDSDVDDTTNDRGKAETILHLDGTTLLPWVLIARKKSKTTFKATIEYLHEHQGDEDLKGKIE
jgi:hypothetical protein